MEDFGFYFKFGWDHIIDTGALDHILFIAVLSAIYMLKDWKQVLILVTAFTIGHAITMILGSRNLIEVNASWIEFLIPCTILVTAIINLFQKSFTHKAIRINYFLALFFGLIHGLAYANLIKFMLIDEQDFMITWFSFSLGLEAGQILVVLAILLLAQLFVNVLRLNRRIWVLLLSGTVLVLSVKMAIERIP
ncbi:MAG: HupE/UreJ family protein [Flavisolibacter sp.]